ncbi:hypothetical protein C7S16_4758 [Burkholderia thailandensis]|uniref:Uncharacterized protein n=1 Tax=Burkholderia thailandensis TaxID=57975 RepID=A0AAW9CTF7_BURTH|nr:hypothetical protein [Burkholderia thailandensis]MDW9252318.1 hypothetical protein [Burkholderia thailandensis]
MIGDALAVDHAVFHEIGARPGATGARSSCIAQRWSLFRRVRNRAHRRYHRHFTSVRPFVCSAP